MNNEISKIEVDEKKDEIRLTRVVNLSPYLEQNKIDRAYSGKGFSKSGNVRRIGSIPIDALLANNIDVHDKEQILWFLKTHPEYRVSEGDI